MDTDITENLSLMRAKPSNEDVDFCEDLAVDLSKKSVNEYVTQNDVQSNNQQVTALQDIGEEETQNEAQMEPENPLGTLPAPHRGSDSDTDSSDNEPLLFLKEEPADYDDALEEFQDSPQNEQSAADCDVSIKVESMLEVEMTVGDKDESNHMEVSMVYPTKLRIKRVSKPKFRCKECDKNFKTSKKLTLHISKHHPKKKTNRKKGKSPEKKPRKKRKRATDDEPRDVPCVFCGISFKTLGRLRFHQKNKHNLVSETLIFKCDVCESSYDKLPSLHRHVKRKHPTENANTDPIDYHCNDCGRDFETDQELRKHRHILECKICGMIYNYQSRLHRHLRLVHNVEFADMNFQCSHCDEGFVTKRALRLHIIKAHMSNKYTCMYCERNFRLIDSLRRHVYRKHTWVAKDVIGSDKAPGDLTIDLTNPGVEESLFTCSKCGAIEQSWNRLQLHVKRKHCSPGEEGGAKKSRDQSKIPCKICNKMLKVKGLKRHVEKNHPDTQDEGYPCNLCDFTSTKKRALKKHVAEEHEEFSKPYFCDIEGCTFKSAYVYSLYMHRLTHDKEANTLYCSKCEFKSTNKYVLKYHEEEHETGIKKFQCETCNYSTIHQGNLIRHKDKHNTEKLFQCDACPTAYKHLNSLRIHYKKMHSGQGEELFNESTTNAFEDDAPQNSEDVPEPLKAQIIRDAPISNGVINDYPSEMAVD